MQRKVIAAILVPIVVIALIGGNFAHYELSVRSARLRDAGTILIGKLETDVAVDTVLPPAKETGNAGTYYIRALNDYNERRRPYLLKRGLSPIAIEPRATDGEIELVELGSRQSKGDFFEEANGKPKFIFKSVPDNKIWPMHLSSDPFEFRPYTAPLRTFAQAVLNRGKESERGGDPARAVRIYQIVARLGYHLRTRPGSLSDIELGIDIERRGIHYLEVLFHNLGATERQKRATRYDQSLERLLTAVRRKYAQLDNPEAALQILEKDVEPVWRIEAAVALVSASQLRSIGMLDRWTANQALNRAGRDGEPHVRHAIARLMKMSQADFRNPPNGKTAD